MPRAVAAALLFLWALASGAVMSGAASAQVNDPRLPFRTLRSEHFEIHYHVPLGVVARRTARVLEDVHARAAALMGYSPRRRVHVVLTDGTESANGSATALPVNTIRLFVAAPDDLSVLADYDDWLTTLSTHEYTHILHLDNVGGIPSVVNAVVGKIWAPNHLLPRFITEGMAVYVESTRTSGGRLRSSQWAMYMRMAALDDALLRLDQVTHGTDAWPFGNAFYLYGSHFIEYVVSRHGEQILSELARFYGRRAVPYGVSRAFLRATDHTLPALYDDFLAALRQESEAVRARVEAGPHGRVEGERLTRDGLSVQYPRFVDDDTVLYRVSDGHSDNQLRMIDARGGHARELSRVAGAPSPSIAPDGRVYADMLDSVRDIYFLYDLFRYEASSDEWERLTYGMRARAPDVAPDGRQIAFTSSGAGTTHLMIADTADVAATARPLLRMRRYEQAFTPRFSPDGKTVALSAWRHGGFRDVLLVDVESGDARGLMHDRASDTGPTFSPDGAYVYFSSDRTGIANIYRYRLADGALEQVTNVVAGAYMPVISPDGKTLVYVGYTSRGFDLWRLDLEAIEPWPAEPYVDDRPPPSTALGIAPIISSRYRAVRTLYPRHVLFDLTEDAFGRNLGLLLSGADIAGFYSWSARLGASLSRGYPTVDATFAIHRLFTPITFTFFRRVNRAGGLVIGGEQKTWRDGVLGGSVSLRYDIPNTFHTQSLRLAYAATHHRNLDSFGLDPDPNDPPPVLPFTGLFTSASLGYTFSNARQHSFDIAPSEGGIFGLGLSGSDPVLGSPFRNVALTWFMTRYVEMPFIQHHVLSLHYAGGISAGDPGRAPLFGLGGFPNTSIVDSFLNDAVLGGQALRGYAPRSRVGTRYQLLQAEYRLPIWRPMAGYATLPLYLRRIYGLVFFDVGDAYDGRFDAKRLRAGVGAEIFLQFTTAYFVDWSLRTGFAYGIMEEGGARFYSHLGFPF